MSLFTAVPEPVNLTRLESVVVDLLRVRLTWPIPEDNNAEITMYTISHCFYGGSNCTPGTPITIPANETVSSSTSGTKTTATYVLQSGANLDEIIGVNIIATNRIGNGIAVGGPRNVSVATTSRCTSVLVYLEVCESSYICVISIRC